MAQKIAFFDLDGTLFRWQLFHEQVFELKALGALDKETAEELDDSLIKWQGKEASWNAYETVLINELKKHLVGMSVGTFEEAAKNVISRSGHKIYNYTKRLADTLKADGYFLLAVTGSYQEIAEPFARQYGFDDCIGAVLPRENGLFTASDSIRVVYGQKANRIREYLDEGDFSLKDSIAVGDSGGDIDMLHLADRAIGFNPSQELLDVATDEGWDIVIERKNIAYSLKKGNDGSFLLAKTDRF